MIEAVLIAWMAATGALLLRSFWPRLPLWALGGLFLPVGAAAYLLVSLGILAFGGPFSTVTGLAVASGAGGVVVLAQRHSPAAVPTRTYGVVAATVVGIGLLAAVFEALQLTRVTSDSLRYLLSADVIETTGSLDGVSQWDLRMRHLVVPLLHTPGIAAGHAFSAAITPLLTLSGLVVAGWLGWEALDDAGTPVRYRRWILAAPLALLLTTNRFVYHAFYVNGHMMFAVFLVVGVGLAIRAVATEDWTLLQVGALAFAALPALRAEAVITATVFLVPILTTAEIPRRQRWQFVAPFVAATVLWDGIAWPMHALDADLGITGPAFGNVLVVVGLVIGMAALSIPAIERFGRWGIWLVAIGLAAYVALTAVGEPAALRQTLAATGTNLAVEGLWGTFWWLVPLLLVGAWVATAVPHARLWLHPVAVYGIALLAFSSLRGSAYRIGTGDSGSRMLMHVTLVAMVGLVATAGRAAAESEATSAPAVRSP